MKILQYLVLFCPSVPEAGLDLLFHVLLPPPFMVAAVPFERNPFTALLVDRNPFSLPPTPPEGIWSRKMTGEANFH